MDHVYRKLLSSSSFLSLAVTLHKTCGWKHKVSVKIRWKSGESLGLIWDTDYEIRFRNQSNKSWCPAVCLHWTQSHWSPEFNCTIICVYSDYLPNCLFTPNPQITALACTNVICPGVWFQLSLSLSSALTRDSGHKVKLRSAVNITVNGSHPKRITAAVTLMNGS